MIGYGQLLPISEADSLILKQVQIFEGNFCNKNQKNVYVNNKEMEIYKRQELLNHYNPMTKNSLVQKVYFTEPVKINSD